MSKFWSIQEVATMAGISSRALRHYDAIGLLPPTEIAANGYRLYDASALIRLQRILALRDVGMSLPEIAHVLDNDLPEVDALASLEERLRHEVVRLERQIRSIQRTREARMKGESPMSANMFDGFQHEQYKDEVIDRWGADAYAQSDAWWRSMSDDERAAWKHQLAVIGDGWAQLIAAHADPASDASQVQAAAHVNWLRGIPGTPATDGRTIRQYVLGLAEMYVADPRFAANYGGEVGATFVRDALTIYANAHLA